MSFEEIKNPASESENSPVVNPAAQEPEGTRPRGVRETSLRPIFGLALLWIILVLVFKAHTMSDAYIVIGKQTLADEGDVHQTVLPNGQNKLLLPITMSWHGISPRQALDLIAQHIGYQLKGDGVLDEVDGKPQTIRLENLPLGDAIHRLLGNEKLGFGLNGANLQVFPQQLELIDNNPTSVTLRWEAEVPLQPHPMVVSPTVRQDFHIALYLTERRGSVPLEWSSVAIEVWQRTSWLAMAQVELDERGHGAARLDLPGRSMQFDVTRLDQTTVDTPPRFRLRLHFSPPDANLSGMPIPSSAGSPALERPVGTPQS